MKKTMIKLPCGGSNAEFDLNDFKSFLKKNKLKYMIIGQTHVSYKKHPKVDSLDMWLRNLPSVNIKAKDTCQAVNSVIKDIISSEDFALGYRKYENSKRLCKSIVLL